MANSSIVTNVSYSTRVPSTRPSTVLDRMNFLRLTEPNTTDSMGQVNFSQQIDAEKCDYVIIFIIIIIKNNNNDRSRQLTNLMHKFFFFIIISLYSSTCFEHCCAHQELNLYYTASGIVTLCRWPSGAHRTATYRV